MAERAPFPSEPEDFDRDDRISFSKQSATFILEAEDGTEWEWLDGPRRWTKTMDEALVQQQAQVYKVAGVDDDAPALDPVKKRKAAQDDTEPKKKAKAGPSIPSTANANANAAATATATAAGPPAARPKPSTAIFVSGLPLDADEEEVRDCFRKFGMIAESADGENKKRVRLYLDDEGNPKGEALVIYFKPESVQMAINLQDGYDFPRDPGLPTGPITVVEADSTYKKTKDDTAAESKSTLQKAKPSKAKTKKKAEEMNSRLADWSDDDVSAVKQTSRRYDKVVVLKHVFDPEEIKENRDVLNDIMEDMQDGAEGFGNVKNITLFDLEEDGVVTIRFENAEAARACVSNMDGRWYDKRMLKASIATGEENFKKSRKLDKDKDAEEAKRLEEYSKFIEGKADGDGAE